MRSDRVVVMDIGVDAGNHLPRCWIFLDVDVIILQAAKEPFGSDIVERLALAIHGDLHLAAFHQIQIGLASEMAALVRVDNLRLAMAQGTPQAAQDKFFLQAIAEFKVHNLSGIPVDDHKQVQKSFVEGQIGDVDTPNLVLMINGQIPQQIGPHILLVITLAEIWPRKQGDNVQNPHQAPHALPVDVITALVLQIVGHFAVSPRRPCQMGLVNDSHDVKVLLTFAMAGIGLFLLPLTVDAGAIDFCQFTLPLDCQLRFSGGNESDAVRRGQRFRQIFF